MKAEIIAVGTELLMGEILNTNAQEIARELYHLGVDVYHQSVVGDNLIRVSKELETAFERADLVITTGGLGPTRDDITKEAAAKFLDRKMILDNNTLKSLKLFFNSRGLEVNEGNMRQAYFPEGSTIIRNNNGTAPGCMVEFENKILIILPGPPREVKPMMKEFVLPYLKKLQGKVFVSTTLNICGIGEGHMEEKIIDLVEKQTNPTIAPYAKEKGLTLRLTASGKTEEEAIKILEPVEKEIEERLGLDIFAKGETDLESVVSDMLIEKGLTLSTAESCTGGMLSSRIINYPGASKFFKEGLVTYSNESKIKTLGVQSETIEQHGAVSEQVAKEMAHRITIVSKSDIGISVTGIAGPDGGTKEKPVGLVYIGLSINGDIKVKKINLWGNRANIRRRTTTEALDFLRRELIGLEL